MHNLLNERLGSLVSGLKHSSITKASEWATQYRVMGEGSPYPGLFSFKHHPWLKGMHDSTAHENVGMKCAQMGFTETLLNITLFTIDIKRANCLYLLPSESPDASRFSASRFDPALELSDHLRSLFTDTKNINHKRAGSANLFVGGARARGGLKSAPVSRLMMDEMDEYPEENIPLAMQRVNGQNDYQIWMVSTPTFEKKKIHSYFLDSTQEHFVFRCPHCSRFIELNFPDNLVITGEDPHSAKVMESYIICNECKHPLNHNAKVDFLSTGVWQPMMSDRTMRGFYVNQLYSMTDASHPGVIAKSFLKSQIDPAEEQEFYNSRLGLPHVAKGCAVSSEDIARCLCNSRLSETAEKRNVRTLGADVGGTWIHVIIEEWEIPNSFDDVVLESKPRPIYIGKVQEFDEVDNLFYDFDVDYLVIDANPEVRKSLELVKRHSGRARRCWYMSTANGREIVTRDSDTVQVNRTSYLDLSQGRFLRRAISLPVDTPYEAKEHFQSIVRRYEKDPNGNPVAEYVSTAADHFAHARLYSEVAFALALASSTGSTTIKEKVL